MQYAAHLPTLPSRRSLVAPVVALVVGAGAAVGTYALIDDQAAIQGSDTVVFVDSPAPGSGVRGLDDSSKAATIGATPVTVIPYLSHGQGVPSDYGASAKHESSTAAAIGSGAGDVSSANRTDPHGTAAQLHSR